METARNDEHICVVRDKSGDMGELGGQSERNPRSGNVDVSESVGAAEDGGESNG